MNRVSNLVHSLIFLGVLLTLAVLSLVSAWPFSAARETAVLNGKLAHAFEQHYDSNFPLKQFSTNLWAALDLRLFGEGRPGVVLGRDHWLFSDEEFKPAARVEQLQDNWLLIRSVQEELQRRGATLVLVLLPAKARLYPEYLNGHVPVAAQLNLYADALQQMQQAQIVGPQLLPALLVAKARQPVFLRTDTHWTPFGAEVVARSVADYLNRSGHWATGTQAFVTEAGASQTHKGDLLSFLPLDPYFTALQPPAETLQLRRTALTESPEADLFGAQSTAIALVGTSYSANPKWNFAGALKQALASDLLNYAEDGHGPMVPMLHFLQRKDPALADLKLVLWEVPERYLNMPSDLSEFDPVWLAQLKANVAEKDRLAASDSNPARQRL